ncbi:MAG: Ferredoxin 2Fe-2S protein [Candidatus Uhrbacteria bacterium GW2011_GWA2_52_8d]|uniref:Ferredoxin 2Fe-2S protein n=1 Tax=Candidatus Uhrbacteria bacterium GW2011_GWA2_52_8d TaxID=1618979 RepID=A0A0G1XNW6_9BACT|nr:MAG: Ferredoxin 2Fe-2S protein [Candidatus Uhrbacteria bacterium GW2011_GWA2_52_8d]
MYELEKNFRKLVLVCTNERSDGRECCADKGSLELHQKIKFAMAAVDPKIRVSKSGCLDRCSTGSTVVIMPDNIWLGRVQEQDIPELVKRITS